MKSLKKAKATPHIPSSMVLYEHFRGTDTARHIITTDYYSIGYVLRGNVKINNIDIPEGGVYIVSHGEHIAESFSGRDGSFEQVVMHLPDDNLQLLPRQRDEQRLEDTALAAIASNLSIEELAKRCYLSVSTFKRHFRELYHTSPHRWLKTRRLELAYHIVINTNLPIAEVARRCGFVSTTHFTASFKHEFNVTPLRLRYMMQNKANIDH